MLECQYGPRLLFDFYGILNPDIFRDYPGDCVLSRVEFKIRKINMEKIE